MSQRRFIALSMGSFRKNSRQEPAEKREERPIESAPTIDKDQIEQLNEEKWIRRRIGRKPDRKV